VPAGVVAVPDTGLPVAVGLAVRVGVAVPVGAGSGVAVQVNVCVAAAVRVALSAGLLVAAATTAGEGLLIETAAGEQAASSKPATISAPNACQIMPLFRPLTNYLFFGVAVGAGVAGAPGVGVAVVPKLLSHG